MHMRSGNLYSNLPTAKKTVKGSFIRALLLAAVFLCSQQIKAQTYSQVSNTSGTSVVDGITVTVTTSGGSSGADLCSSLAAPYVLSGGSGSYTYTFSAPVGSVEIPLVF